MCATHLRPVGIAAAGLVSLLFAACSVEEPPASGPDPRLAHSRAATARLGSELKARLTAVMSEQGPVAAVAVCADEAPTIAARLSDETGATVGRTALRVRNPANAPATWAADAMRTFADRLTRGDDPADIEFSSATPDGGFRYMKPIVTAPVCLTCHGMLPPGALADAIANTYPKDRATGFEPGDLRGAFVVEWSP